MADKSPKAIGKTLKAITNSQPETEELFFDPKSGALEVTKKGEVIEDPDRVPATQMAREGFFV